MNNLKFGCASIVAVATTTFNMGFYFVVWRDTYLSLSTTLSGVEGLLWVYTVYQLINIIFIVIVLGLKKRTINCIIAIINIVIILYNFSIMF